MKRLLWLIAAVVLSVWLAMPAASAQTLDCPAGGAGGSGGAGGTSRAGNGGVAINVPVPLATGGFATTGNVSANGGDAGSARGGLGGDGGDGFMPICNQNTNNVDPGVAGVAGVAGVGGAAPSTAVQTVPYGSGGGGISLAATGPHTPLLLLIAGLSFLIGGIFLYLGSDNLHRRRRRARAVRAVETAFTEDLETMVTRLENEAMGATAIENPEADLGEQMVEQSATARRLHGMDVVDAAETHRRRFQRAVRLQDAHMHSAASAGRPRLASPPVYVGKVSQLRVAG